MIALGLLGHAAVNGLLLGLVYTLIGVGLSLTLGVLGIVNVAHSTMVILGAFFAWELLHRAALSPLVAMALAVPLFFLFGAAVDRTLVRRVAAAPQAVGLLVLFGLMIVLESTAILLWTTDTRVLPWRAGQATFALGGLTLPLSRLVAAALALCMVLLLDALLRRTLLGKAIRAVGQNPDAALVLGVDPRRIGLVVMGLGAASAAVGGVALAMIFPFAPQDHVRWLAWAFLVVVVGGLGGVRSSLAAGLLVGEVETLSGVLLPFQYVYLVVYGLLAAALLLRGQGLATVRERTL
ncbi:MAG: branched-chain amino acid ABC transporter permease [Firmicutes bacterium]|nr:branched-chain amino acid ABC transporter permease [Bacillota bacterium]